MMQSLALGQKNSTLLKLISLAGIALISTVLASANTFAATLDFDKTFNATGEKKQLHFNASYLLGDKAHQVEVWRDGDLRLKRRTDNRIETFVDKPKNEVEWHMVVLDLQRKIRTDIDRTNLYRIGHFTDWFSMSHGLTHPQGAYQLSAIKAPAIQELPIVPCRWYALQSNGSESQICWSPALRLPVLITRQDGQVQWRITAVDDHAATAATYQILDDGFARNNADEDMQAD